MDSLPHTQDAQPAGFLSGTGSEMRDLAVAALGNRYRELAERSKRRQLTSAERTELDRLGVVIDTLQAMGGSSSA